jgi:3-phosphoshikimate 1-carboxyvinyltransferase
MSYPEALEILPLKQPPGATIPVPGSKSLTNRGLILAALSDPREDSVLRGALDSGDTQVMIEALRALGLHVNTNWPVHEVRIRGAKPGHPISAKQADLFVANSGTTMRFLTALVSLGHGRYRLDGVARMRERPIEDLLAALRQLGVKAYSENGNGCPPVIVEADGLPGGDVRVKGNVSSQFLSGLLMAAPFARHDVAITVDGTLVSRPYVDMTVQLMQKVGLRVEMPALNQFYVPGNQSLGSQSLDIEPDASAASYFFAAAAITGGKVTVPRLTTQSLQGDVCFVDLLEKMGCLVDRRESGISVIGRPLRGIDVDMNDISDTVMTLAAVALFADRPTSIRNVAHIRHKETDRLQALTTELRQVGARIEEFPDGITITPGPLHGAIIQTHNDHRMAMSLALVGLRIPGIVIQNPGCVAKTYPRFFEDLETLSI